MKILVAEDSRALALPLIAFLKARGHQVVHVSDGRQAVEAFKADPPDLILMDVVMPALDGLEATRQIKALGGDRWVPLMMMTSLSSNQELVAGLEAGADDYLTKPVNFEILEARIRSMQRIASIQESLFGIFDNAYEGMVVIDQKGQITAINKAAEQIFGYPQREVIGRNVNMLMPEPYHSQHDSYLARYLQEGQPRIIGKGRKVSGLRKNGEVFPMQLGITEVHRNNNSLFIGLVRDVSAEEAARQRIEFMAHHDSLTELPNRARFSEVLAAACTEDQTNQRPPPSAVLFMDLDGFKAINDNHGHETGDEALRVVAQRLRHNLAEADFLARLGGDEFVAVLPGVASGEAARTVAQRLLTALARPLNLSGHRCQLGLSIGIALIPQHGHTPTEVLTAADNAMYLAKRNGKNQIVLAAASPNPLP